MPDLPLYLQAFAATAVASALLLLAAARLLRADLATVVALSGGLVVGCYVLQISPRWPPTSSLDRLLTIVLPAVGLIEAAGSFNRTRPWLKAFFRLLLAASVGRILLHDSVYLNGMDWSAGQSIAALVVATGLLLGLWALLAKLSQHSAGTSIPLALAMSIQAAGIAILLAGYIKGGAISFPLSAAICGVSLASTRSARADAHDATIGIGIVALFGLLFVGRFFGKLETTPAMVILLAPLSCCISELSWLRGRSRWLVGSLRLLAVTLPLAIVLVLAVRDFKTKAEPFLQPRASLSSSGAYAILGAATLSPNRFLQPGSTICDSDDSFARLLSQASWR
jgi:hypothetical protein